MRYERCSLRLLSGSRSCPGAPGIWRILARVCSQPVVIVPTTPAVAPVSRCGARPPLGGLVLWRKKSINPPMTTVMFSGRMRVARSNEMRSQQ